MKTPEEIIDEDLSRHDVFSVQADVVKSILEAVDAAGYAIVPKEATVCMLDAARTMNGSKIRSRDTSLTLRSIWTEMVMARP